MNTIEPISGVWTNGSGDTSTQVPVAILQAVDASRVLCVRGDNGELTVISIERIRTDWRFDVERGKWVDISVADDEDVAEDAEDPAT
jgi:hypothetical protein